MARAPPPRHERKGAGAPRADDEIRGADYPLLPHIAGHVGGPACSRSALSSGHRHGLQLSRCVSRPVAARLHLENRDRSRRIRRKRVLVEVLEASGNQGYAGGDRSAERSERATGDLHPIREDRQRQSSINQQSIICNHQSAIINLQSSYRSPSMISSRASRLGLIRWSGSVASGSSTMWSWVRKSSRSGSM